MPRETRLLEYIRTEVTINVMGELYASSPTTGPGIEAMLKQNQPTEGQLASRVELGENLKPISELQQEITEETVQPALEVAKTLEGGKPPSTVFRRDEHGRVFLHSNYFKGHLRDMGESCSRFMVLWGVKDMVTRTVMVCPSRNYMDTEIKCLKTFFTPEIRTAQGITVKMPTEKIAEYVVNPKIKWVLYIGADPRWNEKLLDSILIWGSMRGLGPGRGIDASKYRFARVGWERLQALEAQKRYFDEFEAPGLVDFTVQVAEFGPVG